MKRVSFSTLQMLGSVLVAAGLAVGVPYWIYTLEDSGGPGFWAAPGIVAVLLVVLGVLVFAAGVVRDRSARSREIVPRRQVATTASRGQSTQVMDVSSEGDVTIAPEQRNG